MRKSFLLFSLIFSLNTFAQNLNGGNLIISTYSIVARDSTTGDLGIAVQSKFLGVGAVVPYAKAGVGAVATQASANTVFGPWGLELLERGMTAGEVVEKMLQSDSNTNIRQIGVVDANGNSFAFTGTKCSPYAGHITGPGYCAQGNLLAGEDVVKAMARVFETNAGEFPERLLDALDAAETAGGDKRGRQSAALLVVRENGGYGGLNDRYIDIRVDDDSTPLVELRRIYNLWKNTFLIEARMRTIENFNKNRKYLQADSEKKRLAESLNEQLRTNPDDPEVLNRIARILATSGIDKIRALELARRAVKLAPSMSSYLDTMAECHYHLGNFDEAIAIESELISKNPSNDYFYKQLQKFRDAKQK